MEPFNRIFEHRQEYRIIICKTCGFAVVPQQTASHLKKHHPVFTPTVRKTIIEYVQGLDMLARHEEDVIYPESDTITIPGLPVFENGFRCQGEDEDGKQYPYVC